MRNNSSALEVLDVEFLETPQPLTLEAQEVIYGWGRRQPTEMDVDPIELVTRRVGDMPEFTFCGQPFYAEVLLGLPLNHARLTQFTKSFIAFAKELNQLGELALREPEAMETRVFVGNDKTALFMGAVDRMTRFTSWKIEFVPSETSPCDGLDARIIVPR